MVTSTSRALWRYQCQLWIEYCSDQNNRFTLFTVNFSSADTLRQWYLYICHADMKLLLVMLSRKRMAFWPLAVTKM